MNSFKSHIIRYCLLLSIILPARSFGQTHTYHFDQADSLKKANSKILMVFIHTNWCRYCAGMYATTFKNEDVIKKINKDFYFIELDAEEKRIIFFNGRTFNYKQTGSNTGIHELAEELAMVDKSISYPTICYLNEQYEIIYKQTGFIKSKDILLTLTLLSQDKSR